jgi:hypothetical protein
MSNWRVVLCANLPEFVTNAELSAATGLNRRSVSAWLANNGVSPVDPMACAYVFALADVRAAVVASSGSGNWMRGPDRSRAAKDGHATRRDRSLD